MENAKKYPDFDFKPLKTDTQIAIFRAVLGLFWEKLLQFSKYFLEDPKNTKIRILYPKKYDEHTYHFTMKVPPWAHIAIMATIPLNFASCSLTTHWNDGDPSGVKIFKNRMK